jgi:hypothetical protein
MSWRSYVTRLRMERLERVSSVLQTFECGGCCQHPLEVLVPRLSAWEVDRTDAEGSDAGSIRHGGPGSPSTM